MSQKICGCGKTLFAIFTCHLLYTGKGEELVLFSMRHATCNHVLVGRQEISQSLGTETKTNAAQWNLRCIWAITNAYWHNT